MFQFIANRFFIISVPKLICLVVMKFAILMINRLGIKIVIEDLLQLQDYYFKIFILNGFSC